MKKILYILFWTLLVTAVITAMAFIGNKHDETTCRQFELYIAKPGEDALMSAEDISGIIIKRLDSLEGKTLGEIDIRRIHNILDSIPYIRKSDVKSGISGMLSVAVHLRQPLLRIIDKNHRTYYIDREGYLLPLRPGYPGRVFIANGNISLPEKENLSGRHISSLPGGSPTVKLYELALKIDSSPFLKHLLLQVWINGQGEAELVPLLGGHTIHFGSLDDMDEKLGKLITFYREGAAKAGWIEYRSIDLRYKNQIICSKK
jgi:cell division protein FtsQ